MTIPCDVVLLPNKELAVKAIEASNLLRSFGSFFTLEIGKFYPHMSLYMFQLDENYIAKITEILQNIANIQTVINAEAYKYSLGQGPGVGYIDPEYVITNELVDLQNQVIESINPIRSGMRISDIEKMKDATGVKLDNLQKYGYPAVGELFRPHITLTKLKEYQPEVLNILPNNVGTFSGIFDKIGLFEMGSNGTCVREIISLELKSVI